MGLGTVLKAAYRSGRKGQKSEAAQTLDGFLQNSGRVKGAAGYGGARGAQGLGKVVDAAEDIVTMPAGVLSTLGLPIAASGPVAIVVGLIVLYFGYNRVM